MLEPVAGGARLGRAVKKPFGGTEVPPVKRLVELHQKLVQGLSSARETEAESLKLADRLLRTVIQYESLQARIQQQQAELELDKRKLQLAEKKAAPAGTAGEISVAANLTREEREARIREIYGR